MTFTNKNKDKIKIIVNPSIDFSKNCFYRVVDICITPYKKRKAISLASIIRDKNEYRMLDREGRGKYVHNEFLKYCSEEQLQEAVQEIYRKMAPTNDRIEYIVY